MKGIFAVASIMLTLVILAQPVVPLPDDFIDRPGHINCEVCREVSARVEQARVMLPVPYVVRTTPETIMIEGATTASSRPFSELIRDGDSIVLDADADTEYVVSAYVKSTEGVNVPFDFEVGLYEQPAVTPSEASRPLGQTIEVTNCTFAWISPGPVEIVHGVEIGPGWVGHARTDGKVTFKVKRDVEYTVTAVLIPDHTRPDTRVHTEFTLPFTREHRIEAAVRDLMDAQRRFQTENATFFDIQRWQAIILAEDAPVPVGE